MIAMLRFLRLYWAIVKFSISQALEFRVDLIFRLGMDITYYTINIVFFKILFHHTNLLGGWRGDEVMLFLSEALLMNGLFMTFIARNIWEFPAVVNRGELDSYLTRPVSPLLTLLLRHFQFGSLLNLLLGFLFFAYALSQYQGVIFWYNAFAAFLMFINGFVLLVCLRLLSVIPVFWTQSQFGFHMLFQSFEQVLSRPEVIFRGVTHAVFLTLVPLFVVTSFPARVFFGELTFEELLFGLLITTTFCSLIGFIWKLGLRSYSSASS